MRRTILVAALLAAAFQTSAFTGGDGVWSAYDADRNGSLDATEFAAFRAGQPGRLVEAGRFDFERFDTNRDGSVSLAEFTRGMQTRATPGNGN